MATDPNVPSPSSSSPDPASISAPPSTSPGVSASSSPGNGADLMGRVVQGAHATIDRLAESAAPHVHRLEQGMHDTGDKVHARVDQMREVGEDWTESLRCTVRDHPLAAVGLALAAGMLIARLTR